MTEARVLYEREGDVGRVTLNQPDILNAINTDMVEELLAALDQASKEMRCVLLTGAGRGFCAGANLANVGRAAEHHGSTSLGASIESHFNPLMRTLRGLPVPLVTAVRGPAAGIGCSIALAGDIIIASDTAKFLQAFVNIGLIPDGGSTWLLARAVGRVRAMEMMMLGEKIPADRAYEWGLVTRLVADDDLDATALELATRLAAGPTTAIATIRDNAWKAADQDFESILNLERDTQSAMGETADHVEGITAFLQKRAPRFTGV